jgi:hypothetical protein
LYIHNDPPDDGGLWIVIGGKTKKPAEVFTSPAFFCDPMRRSLLLANHIFPISQIVPYWRYDVKMFFPIWLFIGTGMI